MAARSRVADLLALERDVIALHRAVELEFSVGIWSWSMVERVPFSSKGKEAIARSGRHGGIGLPRGAQNHPCAKKTKAVQMLVDNRALGRPTLYRAAYCDLVYKYRLLGLSEERIAELLEVSIATLHEWRKVHAAFSSAYQDGGELADAELARSMFQRAQGYSHKAEKIQFVKVGDGVEVMRAEYTEHYPPDTAAGVFLLTNRQPKLWRRRDLALEEEGDVAGQVVVRVIGGLPDAVETKRGE